MKCKNQNFRRTALMAGGLLLVQGLSTWVAQAGEEFRTNRGKIYQDCEVVSKDAYGIMIRHREGAARLAFCDLPEPTQRRFNYDHAEAEKFVERRTRRPERGSRPARRPGTAKHFDGFSPHFAATRAHLAFAGGLLGTPFGGSLGIPGLQSFDAWQTDVKFANQNPYHSTHRSKVKGGHVYLDNRVKGHRYDAGRCYNYAFQPSWNPDSYLQNGVRLGNPIAPAMNVNFMRATNGGNPIAPGMMSYMQFQDARAQAFRNVAPMRPMRPAMPTPRGGGGRK